jgi:hypothetical protein
MLDWTKFVSAEVPTTTKYRGVCIREKWNLNYDFELLQILLTN